MTPNPAPRIVGAGKQPREKDTTYDAHRQAFTTRIESMRRWRIRAFRSPHPNIITYRDDPDVPGTIRKETLADPERRLEGVDLISREGKPFAPATVARIKTQAKKEPDRVLVQWQDDDKVAKNGRRTPGRQHFAWVFLSDYDADTWAGVDWDAIMEALERKYGVAA